MKPLIPAGDERDRMSRGPSVGNPASEIKSAGYTRRCLRVVLSDAGSIPAASTRVPLFKFMHRGVFMQTGLQKQAKKAIDVLPDEKVKVVIDFIGYLQSKSKIPNALTLETFRKTDAGEDLVQCKSVEDMFKKLGI